MKNKLSLSIVVFLVAFAAISQMLVDSRDPRFGVITSDVKGYYAYLPLIFIYDDLEINHPKNYGLDYDSRIWYSTAEDGSYYIKFPVGPAILYSPFFFAAHLYASLSDAYPPDGFSKPYQICMAISALFYMLLGLIFFRKILLRFFSDRVSAITIFLLFLGSNLWYYYTVEMCMSHGYSFAMLALFMYTSILWLEKPGTGKSLVLGITAGLIVLLRPIDVIFLSFLIIYGVDSLHALKERIVLLWKHSVQIGLILFVSFLVVLPQLFYWKFVSGSYLFFSYSEETFLFLNPKLLESVFSYRNGWLVYSPIMFFPIVGLFFVKKNSPPFYLFLILAVPLYIYVISSWWCWWYVGFGNRAFINLYPFLGIALAALIQVLLSMKKKFLPILTATLAFVLISLNLFQTYQFQKAVIHYSAMTKEAYWDSFGRTRTSQLYKTFLREVDNEQALQGRYCVFEPQYELIEEVYYGFDDAGMYPESKGSLDSVTWYSPEYSFHVKEGNNYAIDFPVAIDSADEIYITLMTKGGEDVYLVLAGSVYPDYYAASSDFAGKDKGWKKRDLYAVPGKKRKAETMKFYIFNKSLKPLWVDDLTIVKRKVNYVSTPVNFFD